MAPGGGRRGLTPEGAAGIELGHASPPMAPGGSNALGQQSSDVAWRKQRWPLAHPSGRRWGRARTKVHWRGLAGQF
eukprot:6556518-Pyramimonas_sp.AAC.1